MGIYFNPGNASFRQARNSMIYVDKTELFEDTKIADETKNFNYKKYMNKYNVIHLDIASFWDNYKDNLLEKVTEYIYKDFRQCFGNELDYSDNLNYNLIRIYKKRIFNL